ncbi:MAG: hypothetical protein AAGG08_05890 [Actinomycetota bacterium]
MAFPLLVVLDVGRTTTDDGAELPTVIVDASAVPEVADLARVHAIDGIGDVNTTAELLDVDGVSVVLVGVALTRPVTAAFTLAFDLTVHGAFLAEVAEADHLVIATTDPERAAEEHPLWLGVDIDGGALRAVLAH